MWCLFFFLFSIFLILPIKNTKSQTRYVDSNILVTILDVPAETRPPLVAEVTLAALVAHRVEGLVQLEPRLSVKSPVTLLTLMGSGVNHCMLRKVILSRCFVVAMRTGMQQKWLLRTFSFVSGERVCQDEP